jgi:nicotinamide riboside kinase
MRIAITGPESTGKSTLAAQLAQRLGLPYIEEYARAYVERLGRPYNYSDVENIARHQCEEIKGEGVFDTELLLTKVWFIDKYGTCPDWLEEALHTWRMDFYLLTKPDLPFVPDPVRENPDRREELFETYRQEIEKTGVPYSVVSGQGEERLNCALNALKTLTGKTITQ